MRFRAEGKGNARAKRALSFRELRVEELSSYHLLILLLAALAAVTLIVRSVLRAIAASRLSISRVEAAELRAEVTRVRERLAVIERLQIASRDNLGDEIEQLRDA